MPGCLPLNLNHSDDISTSPTDTRPPLHVSRRLRMICILPLVVRPLSIPLLCANAAENALLYFAKKTKEVHLSVHHSLIGISPSGFAPQSPVIIITPGK